MYWWKFQITKKQIPNLPAGEAGAQIHNQNDQNGQLDSGIGQTENRQLIVEITNHKYKKQIPTCPAGEAGKLQIRN
ncbi:MAG: hypothetical protein R2787_06750 [Saprospiraceae bacterium]